MRAYSQDLRERVLRALERGDRPAEIARRFEVSRVWVYQVRDRWQQDGSRSSLRIGGHRRSCLPGWHGGPDPRLDRSQSRPDAGGNLRAPGQGGRDSDQAAGALASIGQVESDL